MAISKGNIKVGKIPNVSLPPVIACGNHGYCKNDCYAMRSYKQYNQVRKSWQENYNLAIKSHEIYFSMIDSFLWKHKPRMFRWHVSGDILSQKYLGGMVQVALNNPEIKFLAFTKMFKFDYSGCPENLAVVFSMWPGMKRPRFKKGVSGFYWMQDGTEKRVPHGALECFGHCDNCGMCWNLKNLDIPHIRNHKH